MDGSSIESAMNPYWVTIITQKVPRLNSPYLYGVIGNKPLEFECVVTAKSEISAPISSAISRWLFGQRDYKKLQITQGDMGDITYFAFLKNPKLLRVGNKIHGYRFTVTCNAPWGWSREHTITKTQSEPVHMSSFYDPPSIPYPGFQNESDGPPVYPIITFTVAESESIRHLDKIRIAMWQKIPSSLLGDRAWPIEGMTMTIEGLDTPGDVVTINCATRVITSGLGINYYPGVQDGLLSDGTMSDGFFKIIHNNDYRMVFDVGGLYTEFEMKYRFPKLIS